MCHAFTFVFHTFSYCWIIKQKQLILHEARGGSQDHLLRFGVSLFSLLTNYPVIYVALVWNRLMMRGSPVRWNICSGRKTLPAFPMILQRPA
jgi:hypothetical protein